MGGAIGSPVGAALQPRPFGNQPHPSVPSSAFGESCARVVLQCWTCLRAGNGGKPLECLWCSFALRISASIGIVRVSAKQLESLLLLTWLVGPTQFPGCLPGLVRLVLFVELHSNLHYIIYS